MLKLRRRKAGNVNVNHVGVGVGAGADDGNGESGYQSSAVDKVQESDEEEALEKKEGEDDPTSEKNSNGKLRDCGSG